MKFVSSNNGGVHINYCKSLLENVFVTFTRGCSFLASHNIANLQAQALLVSLCTLLFGLPEHIITKCDVCLAPLKHIVLSLVHKAAQIYLSCWWKKHLCRQQTGADWNFKKEFSRMPEEWVQKKFTGRLSCGPQSANEKQLPRKIYTRDYHGCNENSHSHIKFCAMPGN